MSTSVSAEKLALVSAAVRESAATRIRLKLARQNPPSSAAASAATRRMSASAIVIAP